MALAHIQYDAAGRLREAGLFKPCASRAYYAAFAASHAILLKLGHSTPREDQGTWNHKTLPTAFVNDLQRTGKVREKWRLQQISRDLSRLRQYREIADYLPGWSLDAQTAGLRLSDAKSILRLAEQLI